MDYEKKLALAKEALDSGSYDKESIEYIFPELKESEGKKTRKKLLEYFKSFTSETFFNGIPTNDAIAWLEKQSSQNLANSAKTCKDEQKPADLKTKAGNWYVCDMEVMNENMVTAFHRDEIYYCPKDGYLDVGGALFGVGCLDVFRLATEKEIPQPKQGEQKPADNQFTPEQANVLDKYIDKFVEQGSAWSEEDEKKFSDILTLLWGGVNRHYNASDLSTWFKVLKDRYTWKPSELQLECLDDAIKHYQSNGFRPVILIELLEKLKKL